MGEQLNMDKMAERRAREAPKESEEITVSSALPIPEERLNTPTNVDGGRNINRRVELNNMVTHQLQITGNNLFTGRPSPKIKE